MVKLIVDLGRGPSVPAIGSGDDRCVIVAIQLRPVPAFGLKIVQVSQEQNPRGLLNIIQLIRDALFGPQIPFNLAKCVLVHAASSRLDPIRGSSSDCRQEERKIKGMSSLYGCQDASSEP